MQNGFILLHRKMMDWEWYKKPKTAHLFRHCLFKANYTDKKWHDITIKRGQFITSRSKLAFETGLSEQEVRTALKNLISTNDLTSEPSPQNTIITVVNYDQYQKDNQRTRRKITTTNNINIKSIDIYKSSSSSNKNFEEFYKNLSEEEEEILKNYSKGEKIRYFRPWLRKIFENGDFKEVLSKAITKDKKEKQKAQRYASQAEVPPEKIVNPADIQVLRDNLKFIKPKGEKKNG